jgi:uncharacterized protein with WD repeat
MLILFIHGWQSTPGGVKPTYLKDHGHTVWNPALPDDDFDAAVRIAQEQFDQYHPDVVVGSSRGGAVAMNINSGETPLVLLCPAWKRWGTATTLEPDTVILHSKADEVVPFTDSQELIRNSGLPEVALIVVGTEHRLADEESLKKMLEAVESMGAKDKKIGRSVVQQQGSVRCQFGIAGFGVITMMYALLFICLQALTAQPEIFGVVAVFLTAIGLGQVVLFNGHRRRTASVIVGSCSLPWLCLYVVVYHGVPGHVSTDAISKVEWCFLGGVPGGAILGYVAGMIIAAVFLVVGEVREFLGKSKDRRFRMGKPVWCDRALDYQSTKGHRVRERQFVRQIPWLLGMALIMLMFLLSLLWAKRLTLSDTFKAKDTVASVTFSPDGKTLASGSGFDSNVVQLWDVASGKNIATFNGHKEYVHEVAFSPDGKTLASGSRDKTIKLWDVATGDNTATFTGHTDEVYSVAFSPDGGTVASGSWDGTIKLWNVVSSKNTSTLRGHFDNVNSVAFSPDGKTLASGSGDKTIKLWDVGGENTVTLKGHEWGIDSVAFSPDGKMLASGSGDRTIMLWDVATGKNTATLRGHTNIVCSVAFSPDGRTLASGSWDRTVRLWNLATGRNTATVTGDERWVYSVAFSPDGNTLASGSFDRTIKLWNVGNKADK